MAFVWALARLDGSAYAANCVATFGVPLPVGAGGTAAWAAATAHGWVGNATEPAVVTARLHWLLFAAAAALAEAASSARRRGCLGAAAGAAA